uniref:Uncharacterized protein n=1 Tax=Balaenoptera musculus TaxID=9771 RepID=A0A8C0I4G7_BALMU
MPCAQRIDPGTSCVPLGLRRLAPAINGLLVTELCCLFCCPPCPGRMAAKLAFLPPGPTYSLMPEPESGPGGPGPPPREPAGLGRHPPGRWKLHLLERADFWYSQHKLESIEVLATKSSRGNRVSCMYVRCVPSAGNFYIGLGTRINCNISNYCGCSVSLGKPSEKNLYADSGLAAPSCTGRASSARWPPWTWPCATSAPWWCCPSRSPRACASPSPTPRRPAAVTRSPTPRRCPKTLCWTFTLLPCPGYCK